MKLEFREKSVHGVPCIEGLDLPEELLTSIRNVITCPDLYNASKAGAFLQGFYQNDGWILVEFLKKDYDDLLRYILERVVRPFLDKNRDLKIEGVETMENRLENFGTETQQPQKHYAVAKLSTLNGVNGFELFLQGNRSYGHYPLDNDRATDQIRMALGDAEDYGFDGIVFEK